MTKQLIYRFLILFLVISPLLVSAFEPPAHVMDSFRVHFAAATSVKWNQTEIKNKEYKVTFSQKSKKICAYFDKSGNLIETECGFNPKELPENVVHSLNTRFEKYKISKCAVIKKHEKVISYELTLKSDGSVYEVNLTADGYYTAR